MKIFQLVTIILVIVFKIEAIDYQNSNFDYSDNNDKNEFNRTYYDYDDSENECSVDTLIDDFVEIILPEDYEENKQKQIKYNVSHLNETIAIMKRLHQYSQNVSEKMKPIMKRVMPRISEILLLIDLPHNCMASLARIGQSAQDGQLWALKCKFRIVYLIQIFSPNIRKFS